MTNASIRAVVIAILLSLALPAQVNKSNLTGVVTDTSGGHVVGAEVRLINLETQVARTEVTDASGIYRFLLADLGTYRLEVTQKGFKRSTRTGILLNAGETTTADVVLEIGEVSDTVTVTGESSLLRTETAALGAT